MSELTRVALVTGLLAIVASVVATLLTGRLNRILTDRQLEHHRKELALEREKYAEHLHSRFHEQRVGVYADYLSASTHAFALISIPEEVDLQRSDELIVTFERLRLVAKTDVVEKAIQCQTWLSIAGAKTRKGIAVTAWPEYLPLVGGLVNAMREELGLRAVDEDERLVAALQELFPIGETGATG